MDDHRIYGEKVPIAMERVKEFYNRRAGLAEEKGWGAVLLGDQNPTIAENMDRYDQEVILPKLEVDSNSSILDLGCGMGRWARLLLPHCGRYHGSDFSEELIKKAEIICKGYPHAEFYTFSVPEAIEFEAKAGGKYNRILLSGVCTYINDRDLKQVFEQLPTVTQQDCLIFIRDTVAMQKRLTLSDFPSEALQAEYSSIYRTKEEYQGFFQPLEAAGFVIKEQNYYPAKLGRARAETNSMYTIFRRGKTREE